MRDHLFPPSPSLKINFPQMLGGNKKGWKACRCPIFIIPPEYQNYWKYISPATEISLTLYFLASLLEVYTLENIPSIWRKRVLRGGGGEIFFKKIWKWNTNLAVFRLICLPSIQTFWLENSALEQKQTYRKFIYQ